MVIIENLYFAYNKRNKLFEKLNLTFSEGRIYGLLGKNGTGKTTFLSLVSGLLFPMAGKIDVLGKNPEKRQVAFLQNLFLVSEEFDVPDVTPKEYAVRYASFYPHFNEKEYDNYLAELNVDSDSKMHNMSMGQRKKAHIAFALACNTSLLLMDEPTNGMDIPSKAQFRKLIASVATESRCIVISTHQVRDLENLIDTIVVLDGHRIIFNESIDTISETLSFVTYNGANTNRSFLYEETTELGGKGIAPNDTDMPSRLDIELFFNGITAESERISELFTNKN